MQTETRTGIRIAGFTVGALLGIVVVVVAMRAAAVPRGTGTLGSDVTVIANSTGEIHVAEPGPFVQGTGLRPGESAEGTVTLANISASARDISLVATPSIRDLNDLLTIEILIGPQTVYRGPLGGLTAGSAPIPLAAGASATLIVRVSLPSDLTDGYQGRIDDVMITFATRPGAGA